MLRIQKQCVAGNAYCPLESDLAKTLLMNGFVMHHCHYENLIQHNLWNPNSYYSTAHSWVYGLEMCMHNSCPNLQLNNAVVFCCCVSQCCGDVLPFPAWSQIWTWQLASLSPCLVRLSDVVWVCQTCAHYGSVCQWMNASGPQDSLLHKINSSLSSKLI